VSYFDEGIFGNFGWGNDAASTPLGASGLVRFDSEGRQLLEFVPPRGFGHMADCYALNACDEAAWAYYYTDFPIVQVSPSGKRRGWKTKIAGARAFATDGQRVLLFGGYGSQRERCVLGELGKSELINEVDYRLELPSGDSCSAAYAVGRGAVLHIITNAGWYQVDVRGLP
jgi:hypothetical protein